MPMGRIILIAGAMSLGAVSAPVYAQGSLPDQLATCARIGKKDLIPKLSWQQFPFVNRHTHWET